jgi:hypothetical protein
MHLLNALTQCLLLICSQLILSAILIKHNAAQLVKGKCQWGSAVPLYELLTTSQALLRIRKKNLTRFS